MTVAAAARGKRALKVFFSYAHQDERLRGKLANHLAVLEHRHLIEAWHDHKIQPGDKWRDEIDKNLEEADLILLLITDNFISSKYCYGLEMKRAIERSRTGEAIVIPILLRDVYWSDAPFAELQALPSNHKPIASWNDHDKAYASVTRGIRERIEEYWNRHELSEMALRQSQRPELRPSPPESPAPSMPPAPAPPSPATAAETYAEKQPAGSPQPVEQISNPYDFEHPAKLYFRGRKEELAELTSHLRSGKSALVLGLQRMGKTSLVERALDLLTNDVQGNRKFIVLRIDMFSSWMSFNSYMDFFFTIVNLLSPHLGIESQTFRDGFSSIARSAYDFERYDTFKSLLKRAIRTLDASLILFLDEFQELERVFERARQRKTPDAFDAGLMRWIGSLAKEQTIQLMICARYRALEIEEKERLEIFKTHHRIPLGPLEEGPARDLIRDPVAGRISYQEEAIRALIELSGRLPYLIQLLCSQLMNSSRVRHSGSIRKKDVEEVAENMLKDPAFRVNLGVLYTDFQEMDNGRAWKALCALAHLAKESGQHVSLADIAQRLRDRESMPNAIESAPTLMERLVTAGIVDETGTGRLRTYRVTPDLLRLWLRKRHSS